MKGISDSAPICMVFQYMLPGVSLRYICALPIGSADLQGNTGREDSPTDNGVVHLFSRNVGRETPDSPSLFWIGFKIDIRSIPG